MQEGTRTSKEGGSGLQNKTQTEARTTQVLVQRFVVPGPRNQTGGFIFKPHPKEIEHELIRREDPSADRFVPLDCLDLVLLERLRGIVQPILSDWEPINVTYSRTVELYPGNPAEERFHLQPLNVAVFGLEQGVLTEPSIKNQRMERRNRCQLCLPLK